MLGVRWLEHSTARFPTALSDLESITLEKAINCVDGHPEARLTKRDAARVGMKRDMSMYRTTASRSSRA